MNSPKEISAEMLLNYLYPEVEKRWRARYKGTFYRNYSRDMVSHDADAGEATLTRNGILRLMPDAAFTDVDELRRLNKAGAHARMMARRQLLNEAFAPFDTINFNYSLKIERKISALLNDKLSYILSRYFAFDIEAEQNPYIKEVATLLPFVSSKRGDLPFVTTLLRSIFDCDVEMDLSHRHSDTDSTQRWMPMVRYNILLNGMDSKTYIRESEALNSLSDFIREWFIPFDVECRISFKQHNIRPRTDGPLVLDYNTEL